MADSRCLLRVGDQAIPLRLRRHKRARRLTLRLDSRGEGAMITLPNGVPIAEALAFAEKQASWILSRLEDRPQPVPFAHGAIIPLRGEPHAIRHRPDKRGTVWRVAESREIHVAGDPAHTARRLRDWLRREARATITEKVTAKAASIDVKPGRITLRDTRSRWGSCAHNGNLSFSWRLILAPPEALDYVVAHEVAHLVHADHESRFHRLAARLAEDAQTGRAWLKAQGQSLHRYGRD
ncbi:M48 family metallopeptidase [Magnetospira sp. QH-2]|uniref:M48 family metallopeptidase n=1 Tax=Magnetospira sp. (strain QH-2) TaxID=1288970 RepID=UPI0003E81A29|nr:SprT family zinc-dependent metalloprotease [Magnetospira sp. QH-2]CCQ75574.1 conserved protein of unknown function [Magnetospira sp. QH-2]